MKKLLIALLMVLCLAVFTPAMAEETPIAEFDFDTQPAEGWTSYTGTGAVANKIGEPQWMSDFKDRTGVMYFDGDDALQLFAAEDMSSLLKDYTTLTISFDYFDATNYTNAGTRDVFYAAVDDSARGDFNYLRYAANTWGEVYANRPGKDKDNGAQEWNSRVKINTPHPDSVPRAWYTVKIELSHDGLVLSVADQKVVSSRQHIDLPTILGSNPVLYFGAGKANDSQSFIGYIDNIKITGSDAPPPIEAALNPFNNPGNRKPSLYGSMTLKEQGSGATQERIVFPVAEGATITLPCEDSLRSGFTIGGNTYVLEGELQNPRKLIGWYNIADGNYYSVLNGDAKNVPLTGNNDVFYGDWIASSYDFLGDNKDGLITTADTSEFIDINVFDYSDLVNVNSMTVRQTGVTSEEWIVQDKREDGWLAFSDWGTYEQTGSIGYPSNRTNSVHGYYNSDVYPNLLAPYIAGEKVNTLLLNTMFSTASKPGISTYIPGINYLGKGNYLFKYDPATSMYSYDCEENAAVYQQSEGRFYVYDSAIDYVSDNNSSHNPDFFPLNKKSDNLNQTNGVPNYWFGLNTEMEFWLPDNSGSGGNKITNADGTNSDMVFSFKGDDDMWVLIDGEVVLDIGGVHDEIYGTINFSTGLIEVFHYDKNDTKIVNYSNEDDLKNADKPLFTAGDHTMEIYYLERGGDKSNCTIKFNLLPEYEVEDPGIDTVKIVKEWKGNPPELPATITVELFDQNNPNDVIKTATLAKDEEGNWSHSFSNLPHTNSKNDVITYSVREKSLGSNPNFKVSVDSKVTTYQNAWVFTDMAGLAGEKNVVIGNGKGKVLGADLKAHAVAAMDEDNNIITQLASNHESAQLLWTVEPATSYPGGKHFYLKNGDKYLCISNNEDGIHLHDKEGVLSVFYLNASGDLQDATTGHRLIATKDGFAVETNVGGNVTTESANKASLHVMRTSETTAYSFTITNTYVDPNVPMGALQISKTIGGNAADADDEFTFLVTLDEKGSLVTGTFDGYEFKNGQCLVTLKGGKSVTITLPEGAHYTVTETDAKGYTLITPASNKYEGTIVKDETAKCPFHNEKNLYSLTVTKTVKGNAADETKAFDFTVTLTDANDKALTGTYGEYTFDAKGQSVISIAHGESFTIEKLPLGAKYTISEDSDGYTQTAPADKEVTGTITTGENKVDFTNVRDVVRLVKVTNPDNLTVAPTVTVTGSDDSVVTAALTANDDQAYLEIPVKPGVTYTVTESGMDIPGYAFAGSTLTATDADVAVTGMTFTVAKNDLEAIPTLILKNAYAQGGLTVSKTVKGNAADANDEFTFTITLTDKDGKPVSGTFDTHTFDANGQCTFTLKSGASESFADLPIGVTYTVTETPALGYVQTAPTAPATGVISTEPAVVSFTNERWAVDIEKVAVGLNGTDTVAPKVTVGDVVIDELPADGVSVERIFVTPGQAYTVAEENAEVPGYTLVSTELTTAASDLTVNGMGFTLSDTSTSIPMLTLTNTYAQGGLTVSKTVKGNAADANDEFTFTVTLTDKDGKPVSGTFDTHTFDENGQCTFTLKGGQSENFADLPIGVTYTVTETPALGYTQTAPTAPATGVITTDPALVSFTNERWAINIEKVAVGLTGTDTVAPKVTVGDVVIDELPADGVSVERIFVTPGQAYTVAEENAEVPGYTLVSTELTTAASDLTVNGMGFTLSDTSTSIPMLTLTNTYAQGGLTVSKTVKGNAADANDEFTFTITLTDKDGKPVSGTFDTHTFDANGQCKIILKGGQSESFADLPIGVTYTVTETPALGYVQTAPTAPATGVITTEPALVSFTNERWAINIEKVAVGLNGTDTVAPKVTVGDVVIDELPADGVSVERIFVTPGKTYTVTEENAEVAGYTLVSTELTTAASDLTVNGMGFTLSDTSTSIPMLTLTNTYAQGGLTVSKTVKGNAADANDEFTFTITLTDKDGKPVSGTFDTHTFDANGQCKIILKGGQSESFADLPIDVTYTVTETPALGYTQTEPTAPATGVITTEPAVVSFTNVRDVVRLVKVTDPTGLTVAPKVTVTGSDGSVVTAEALTANNAAKYLEIPVKPGVTYTVAESGQEIAGYTLTGSTLTAKDADIAVTGMTFTVAKSGMTTVPVLTLTNAYTQDAVTVTIRKASTGLAEGVAYPAPKVSIYPADSTTPVWTGTLTPNGSALPLKLKPGTYTVQEVIDEVEGYGFTSVLYVNGAASTDNTFTLAANAVNTELRLDNFYAAEFSTLTLTKTVTGESGAKTAFSFRITLTDDAGKPITERFPYTGTMDGAAPLTGVVTSGSTVALRDGGSITVQLPLGVHYEVEEQEQEGYVLVSSEGEKGVITKEGAKAAFVNKPQYTVTVTKTWEGDTAETRPASVQVQLLLDGKPVGNPVTLSAANNWTHTYTGLDAKGPYTVDELTVAEGYVSTVEEGEGNTFVITNSYIVIPPTGDAAHPALYLLALVGSAALLMLLRKRKAA